MTRGKVDCASSWMSLRSGVSPSLLRVAIDLNLRPRSAEETPPAVAAVRDPFKPGWPMMGEPRGREAVKYRTKAGPCAALHWQKTDLTGPYNMLLLG